VANFVNSLSGSSVNSEQNPFKTFITEKTKAAEQEAAKIKDIDFIVKLLLCDQDFPVIESEMEYIKEDFLKPYRRWKKEKNWATFLNNKARPEYYKVHSIKYHEETDAMHRDIASDLVLKLESKYSKGDEIVMTKLEKNDHLYPKYTLHYTVKVDEPPYKELTINEIKLDAFECGKVKQNPNFLPTLKVYAGRVLRINDEVYDIRNISQFDDGKLVLILKDKSKRAGDEIFAIYYDMLANLEAKFAAPNFPRPVRFLYLTKETLIAINDSQGLMATYCNKIRK